MDSRGIIQGEDADSFGEDTFGEDTFGEDTFGEDTFGEDRDSFGEDRDSFGEETELSLETDSSYDHGVEDIVVEPFILDNSEEE
jgi:hypothetical protein